jgi:16S rRNA (uracil1498-N3)-methyltransferase
MKIRLYLEHNIKIGAEILLNKAQSHYLAHVLRCKIGAELFIFNNKTGEYKAEITQISKLLSVIIKKQIKDFTISSNISLAFAPVKNVKAEYIVTKATELGANKIYPIITDFTIVRKVNIEKLHANIIEAAEQCERLDLAQINKPQSLKEFIANITTEKLIFADEARIGEHAETAFKKLKNTDKVIIMIGPEGGFSNNEREIINEHPNSINLTLGERVLRADTAIISALALANNYLVNHS